MKRVLTVLILFTMLSGSLKLESETIVVVSNSIDYSPELIAYLQQHFDVISITAEEFLQYQDYEYFVILGGPDALEGIGDIVTGILSPEEQEYVRTPGVSDLLAHIIAGKTYLIMAGSDRDGTRYAVTAHKEKIPGYMPKEPVVLLEDLYMEGVTDMAITDLDNDSVHDYVFGVWKVISDPWDRGAIYVYEDDQLKWYYHLSTMIKALECYDLDSDGITEIIAACEILRDKGDLYVFDRNGNLKWRRRLPGSPRSLYCYDTFVGVNLYGQEERVMIFDSLGNQVKDLSVGGSISKFEIKDVTGDDEYELIVSGIASREWEHFLVVYDLSGNVLWNYETWEHINDFQFVDMDEDGIQETIIGSYDRLYVTRGGDLLGEVEVPPPLLRVEIVDDQILLLTRYFIYLISFSDVLNLNGETIPVVDFQFTANAFLPLRVKPEFLFLEDIDFDEINEIITGDGETLGVYEFSDFVTVVAEVPTAPLEEAEEIPEKIVYLVSVCEVHVDVVIEDAENLNEEWVRICNDGDTDIDMSGWVLMNDVGIFYEFPYEFVLKVGAFVTVYTGTGEDTDAELYWGSSSEVWNNAGDVITLQDSAGNTVAEYIYPE